MGIRLKVALTYEPALNPVCATSSSQHLFIVDQNRATLHIHAWDSGAEVKHISGSRLKLETGQKICGIGVSNDMDEVIIRLLLNDSIIVYNVSIDIY